VSNWTQASCVDCWDRNNPDRRSDPDAEYTNGAIEVCAWCGGKTISGIYVRVDPKTVPFPTMGQD
jgi:hypothetical protein